MASVMTDLHLPSQLQSVTTLWPVPNYTPCLKKKLCKIVFVRTSSKFHQFW